MIDQPLGTVVIGGSQADLSVDHFVKKRDLPFVRASFLYSLRSCWWEAWGGTPSTSSITSFPRGRQEKTLWQSDNRWEAVCVTGSCP